MCIIFIKLSMFSLSERLKADSTIRVKHSGNSLELRLLGAKRAHEKMMIHFQCKVPSLLKVDIIYFWCESLAEALGIQPHVMPEDGHIRLTTGDDISWLYWKTGFYCSSIVDHKDTRSFYKGLLYLRFVHIRLELETLLCLFQESKEKHSIKQSINHQNHKTRLTTAQWSGFCWGMMVEVCGSSGEWWKLSRNAQWSGFCWGMMVEVCGSSGEWWKLSRNVGKWRLQVGEKVGDEQCF
nr:hypothetical protein [Tanacetum cinerariifolium]